MARGRVRVESARWRRGERHRQAAPLASLQAEGRARGRRRARMARLPARGAAPRSPRARDLPGIDDGWSGGAKGTISQGLIRACPGAASSGLAQARGGLHYAREGELGRARARLAPSPSMTMALRRASAPSSGMIRSSARTCPREGATQLRSGSSSEAKQAESGW